MNPRENFPEESQYGKIYIRKRTKAEFLVWIIAWWPILTRLFCDVLGLPDMVKYLADGIILMMVLLIAAQRRLTVPYNAMPSLWMVVVFFLYTLAGNMLNFQSPFYYLWGFRNLFRFYCAFFLFVFIIRERDAIHWLKLMDILFWINTLVSVVQFLMFGVYGDRLGGILGTTGGSNGFTMIIFIIVIGKSLLNAFQGEEKSLVCAAKCGASILVAAMAEMKFYYVVFLALMVLAAMLTRFSTRKMLLLILCCLALMGGMTLLTSWFQSDGTFSWANLWELATKDNYASGEDVNRLSAIPKLSRMFLIKPQEKLFGLGLGNCDTSVYAICNTPFAQTYAYLHYNWFTAPMVFLETGWIGLVIYMGFFGSVFFAAFRQIKAEKGNRLFCQMAIIMSVMCMILTFYNASLRMEAAYMIYFVLALPFAYNQNVVRSGR